MKNIFKMALPVIMIVTGFALQSACAQTSTGANKTLSNLKAPVAVNQSLLAGSNSTLDLGSPGIGWKNLYLTGSIYVSGIRAFHGDSSNTTAGLFSLNSNTGGLENTALGAHALTSNTEGSYNTAVGSSALAENLLGADNTAIGRTALFSNTVGNYNTALGFKSLYSNTEGDYNTATGKYSLYSNSSGDFNTACGYNALYSNTSGSYNTALGRDALYSSTSEYNTAVGYYAGNTYDNSTYNTFLGYDADASSGGHTNSTALGRGSRITGSNQVRIGNSSVSSIGGYAPWSDISDGRFKKNIKENVSGLEFINKLRPVTYTLDVHGINKQTQVEEQEGDAASIAEKERIVYSGFIAQEVEKAAKEIGYDFSGVDAPKNENDLYGLRYSEFVVPLVKAVQEQQVMLNEKEAKIKVLEAGLQNQQAEIEELKNEMRLVQNVTGIGSKSETIELVSACLGQNTPNPFDQSTTINYFLPEKCEGAVIRILNSSGVEMKIVNLSSKSSGQLILKAEELNPGMYIYQLLINGSVVDSKQMVLTR